MVPWNVTLHSQSLLQLGAAIRLSSSKLYNTDYVYLQEGSLLGWEPWIRIQKQSQDS